MIDIKQALQQALAQLSATSPSAQLDAELLLAHTLNRSRTYLYTHPEMSLEPGHQGVYRQLLQKRCEGYPIAYLLGEREFWSLPIRVNEATLIPRPETELLVELTLNLLKEVSHASILDLGTGSGAIALALASERPAWQILACDRSKAALDIATSNASRLGIKNIRFLLSDWFEAIPHQTFDAIVSNPPYIATEDPHLTQGDVRFEPKDALISGVHGLDAISYLTQQSHSHLNAQGLLLLEHGYEQGPAVNALLKQGGYEDMQCWQDHQGHDRVSGAWKR